MSIQSRIESLRNASFLSHKRACVLRCDPDSEKGEIVDFSRSSIEHCSIPFSISSTCLRISEHKAKFMRNQSKHVILYPSKIDSAPKLEPLSSKCTYSNCGRRLLQYCLKGPLFQKFCSCKHIPSYKLFGYPDKHYFRLKI